MFLLSIMYRLKRNSHPVQTGAHPQAMKVPSATTEQKQRISTSCWGSSATGMRVCGLQNSRGMH